MPDNQNLTMNKVKLREEVLNKCIALLRDIDTTLMQVGLRQDIAFMLEATKKSVIQIEELCKIRSKRLCFVGTAGVGKSTAISQLLNLIDNENAYKRYRNLPVLQVYEGRTTSAMTKIVLSEHIKGVSINIEAVPQEEFEKLLDNFTSYYLSRVYPQEDSYALGRGIIPEEIRNCIQSMLGFDEDEVIAFISNIAGDNIFQNVKKLLGEKIQYKNRLMYLAEHKEIFKTDTLNLKELQSMLASINAATLEYLPLPASVTLTISCNLLCTDIPNYITEIIDTRGLDGEDYREDIHTFYNDPECMVIFCDDVRRYGSVLAENAYIRQYFIENQYFADRCILLGLERDNNLLDVKGADEDYTKACKQKIGEAKLKLANVEPRFLHKFKELEYYFYDAYKGYSKSDAISVSNSEEVSLNRQKFFEMIDRKICSTYSRYLHYLADLEKEVLDYKYNTLPPEYYKKLQRSLTYFTKYVENMPLDYSKIIRGFQISSESLHPSKIAASVRRRGNYDNFNVYMRLRLNAQHHIWNEVSHCVEELLKQVEIDLSNIDRGYSLYSGLRRILENEKNHFREAELELLSELLKENIYSSDFWGDLNELWGSGERGYTVTVINSICCEVKNSNIINDIKLKEYPNLYFSEIKSVLTGED